MNDDKKIIYDLKSNDFEKRSQAFNHIYNKYYKLVCFCVAQYLNNKEDQEEIADDTFLNLFNNIENIDVDKNLKYYLLTIAKNNAINRLKKNSAYTTMSDEMLINIPYEDEYESTDLIEKLKDILNMDELFILINHLVYGYSFKEIAAIKSMSINTVMSKYRRTLKKAYKYLEKGDVL